MCEVAGVVISIAALVVSVIAIIVSVVFYFKSAKALQHTTDVLCGYLEGTIKGEDIECIKDKKGHCVSLNHRRPLTGVQAKGIGGVMVPVIKGD